MVKYLINWEYVAEVIDRDDALGLILENLLRDTEIVFSVLNEEKQAFGGLYELAEGGVVFVSNTFKSFTPDAFREADAAQRLSYLTELVGVSRIYPSFGFAFSTLRGYKQDNAQYYEHRYVIDPLIKSIYQHRLVQPGEILM